MQENSPNEATTRVSGVRKVRVSEDRAGQRIDNFLRSELPGVPKGRVYRLLRRGEVRVNGGRIRAEYKLQEGDDLEDLQMPVGVSADGLPIGVQIVGPYLHDRTTLQVARHVAELRGGCPRPALAD